MTYNIKCMNKIARIGLDRFDPQFFSVSAEDHLESAHGVMVRSASLLDTPLPGGLLAVARAGAGVNNIPVADCSEKGVVVFNTPGANANAVRELAVCGLFLASRAVTDGVAWARALTGDDVPAQVEKGKSQFAGPEIMGKTLGVIGLGAIGAGVANAAQYMGMEVYGCDPFISVEAAWGLSRNVKRCPDVKSLIPLCDYISLHVPLNADTRGMINAESMAGAKDGVRVINFARGELVSNADLLAMLDSGKVARYVTDFPNAKLAAHEKVVPIPHLGASTPESEDNCAVMAADQLSDYLRYGVIRNSVNYPNVALPWTGAPRLCVLHKNIPNILSRITSMLGGMGINIDNFVDRSQGEFAYTMLDASAPIHGAPIDKLVSVDGILKIRLIH